MDGNVDVWDVKGILTGTVSPPALSSLLGSFLSHLSIKQSVPEHTFKDLASPVLNLLPNPSPEGGLPNLVLALSDSSLAVLDIGKDRKTLRKLGQPFTSGMSVPTYCSSKNDQLTLHPFSGLVSEG